AGTRRAAITVDRPLYRPGETVWARIWIEDGQLAPSSRSDVSVELLDPRGAVLGRELYPNRGGGAGIAIDLPASAAGGWSSVRAKIGRTSATRPILVAGFEEPRIRKELRLLREAYGPGDEAVAALSVSSSGSGPLVDHPVRVLARVDGEDFDP